MFARKLAEMNRLVAVCRSRFLLQVRIRLAKDIGRSGGREKAIVVSTVTDRSIPQQELSNS